MNQAIRPAAPPAQAEVCSAFSKAAQLAVMLLFLLGPAAAARAVTISSAATGISVGFNAATGKYGISARQPAWTFSGSLGSAAGDVHTSSSRDHIGAFRQITFTWQSGHIPLRGTIRLYQDLPVLLFRYTFLKAASPPSVAFPSFTSIPANLDHFSYRNHPFSPPQFKLGQYGTPWLLFDGHANAMIISPASHFIIAAMHGDGDHLIASGLNGQLPGVPAGFTQESLMAIAPGIRHTFKDWGLALTNLSGKTRPGNESDVTLKYYGYWTDNGAGYYYRYDHKLGYAGTLEQVIEQYRKEKIPVHYFQLDSWWYDKSYKGISPSDHTGRWSSFGGIMRYHADATLFPQGLQEFHKTVGLPLVVHSRWISQYSPYHQNYNISGVAPIGIKWWDHIASYLKSSGVVTYEQDWQNLIDARSPAFNRTVTAGADFYNHMAEACRRNGLTLQYCMPLPCDILQGSRYSNLTTIRTSDDRFSPYRWRDFLYVSQLASAVGAWPWTDVYDSDETDNLLLGVLSAGPVGTGDVLGAEDRANIMKAVRADGVIVKPDVPITPLDSMYVAEASQRGKSSFAMEAHSLGGRTRGADSPFIASAWTQDGSLRTAYVFAFSRSGLVHQEVSFSPQEAGSSGPACVYNYFAHLVSCVARGGDFSTSIGPGDAAYYIVAPVGPSGIALFGDHSKIASMGKERIPSVKENSRSVTAQVIFSRGEHSVTLFGDAHSKPTVTVEGGSAGAVTFNKDTGYFALHVSPKTSAPLVNVGGNQVRRIEVTLTRG
jgi:hypothetical protein